MLSASSSPPPPTTRRGTIYGALQRGLVSLASPGRASQSPPSSPVPGAGSTLPPAPPDDLHHLATTLRENPAHLQALLHLLRLDSSGIGAACLGAANLAPGIATPASVPPAPPASPLSTTTHTSAPTASLLSTTTHPTAPQASHLSTTTHTSAVPVSSVPYAPTAPLLSTTTHTTAPPASHLSTTTHTSAVPVSSVPYVPVNWPVFNGQRDSFAGWHSQFLACLAVTPSLRPICDPTTRAPLALGIAVDPDTNLRLYAQLLLCLPPGHPLVLRASLRGDGHALYHSLVSSYNDGPSTLAGQRLLTSFYSTDFRREDNESIDLYFARFMSTIDKITAAGYDVPVDGARAKFLTSLGSGFEFLASEARHLRLPQTYLTGPWEDVLLHLRHIAANVLPGSGGPHDPVPARPGPRDKSGLSDASGNRAYRDKVHTLFASLPEKQKAAFQACSNTGRPFQFQGELGRMQSAVGSHCVFHRVGSHESTQCSVLLQLCPSSPAPPGSLPQVDTSKARVAHHTGLDLPHLLREAQAAQAALTAALSKLQTSPTSVASPTGSVDSNDQVIPVIPYLTPTPTSGVFATAVRATIKASPPTQPTHMILDSGATHHMSPHRAYFPTLNPVPPSSVVTLADGTTIPILGRGRAHCRAGSDQFTLEDVLFVPSLQDSLFSLQVHWRLPNHNLVKTDTPSGPTMSLTFPTFSIPVTMESDLIVHIGPSPPPSSSPPHVSARRASDLPMPTDVFLPTSDDPTSSFASTTIMDHCVPTSPPTVGSPTDPLSSPPLATVPSIETATSSQPSSTLDPSPRSAPLIRSTDRLSSSLPHHRTLSIDELRSSLGFLAYSTLKPVVEHPELYQPTVSFSSTDVSPSVFPGEVSTINKRHRNTTPLPRPSRFGEVLHCDIIFGPQTSHGGISHALLLVDRASRCKFIYPLRNLSTDLLLQLQLFVAQVGPTIRRLYTDFDAKLLAGSSRQYLASRGIHVQGAAPDHQHQNGLVERHWQTAAKMARAWLANAQLPPSFWYFAAARACEVLNYLPLLDDGSLTTPFELAFGVKPDLRTLFPLFSVGYVRKLRDGSHRRSKFQSHSEPCIAIGRCPDSDALSFFCPTTGKIISSLDYVLDPTVAAGPHFGYTFMPTTHFGFIGQRGPATVSAPLHPPGSIVYPLVLPSDSTVSASPATVFAVPDSTTENYLVSFGPDHDVEVAPSALIPAPLPPPALPDWFRHNAKVTLFLPTMSQPRQGILVYYPAEDRWAFSPGKKLQHQEIPLNLPGELNSLLMNSHLFVGHIPFSMVYGAQQALARVCRSTSPVVSARHVTATTLTSHTAPTSLPSVSKLPPSDRAIWLDAYSEEYDGLCANRTFDILTHDEYIALKDAQCLGPILPSIALATIKRDSNGQPLRAKYRIVVLGNRDVTPWTPTDVSSPVMSASEFRTLVALAIYHKRKLLQGDVKQAFLHSSLPSTDTYIVRPPAHCPRSRPGTLWRLRKSLYGLRRAPKLWYDTITTILARLGLTALPNCPCLFTGRPLPDGPPLYLGLYVDDFVYFSSSPSVERHFETLFAAELPVDFMGVATSFLGVTLTWTEDHDHLSVHLDQLAFTDDLLDRFGMSTANPSPTPYRSGSHVDNLSGPTSDSITTQYQSLVGSLNWLTSITRPDIATITHLLSQYNQQPSSAHLDAARYVLRYLAGTRSHGISFSSKCDPTTTCFNHYPLPNTHADANWGPQDASQPLPNRPRPELPLHHSRSISGHLVCLMGGPVIWHSKRQSVTALSTAEAEIYATTEATKSLIQLSICLQDLDHLHPFFPTTVPVPLYNDNRSCVDWCKSTTTKGTRFIQVRENRVRECIASQFLTVKHIPGTSNIADIFTKEMKDDQHFISLRDHLTRARPGYSGPSAHPL